MWLLTGPFDGELGDLSIQKTKLLKPGSSYTIGRKDTDLIVNSKKVSHVHGEFQLAPMSAQDASSPGYIPAITYYGKKKPWVYMRDGEKTQIPEAKPTELRDGDVLTIAGGIDAKLVWMRLCMFSSAPKGKLPVSPELCGSIGINYSMEPAAEVTHHLTPTYSATPSIAASLVASCHFVQPEWLQEVVRLVESSADAFPVLPPVAKYRPAFAPTLSTNQKVFKAWDPNEERLGLFRKFRFLCVGEKARELAFEYRNLISRGEGSIEVFDVHSGVEKFQKAIRRGLAKERKSLILLGEQASLEAAIGKPAWARMVNEAKSVGARFLPPEALIQAVLDVDTSLLERSSASAQTDGGREEPNAAPSALSQNPEPTPKEDTPPPAPRRPLRRLTRTQEGDDHANAAAESAIPSVPIAEPTPPVAPSLLDLDAPPPPPRKPLVRRLRTGSVQPEGSSEFTQPPPPQPIAPSMLDFDAPLPPRRPLKRRARETSVDPEPVTSSSLAMGASLAQSSGIEDSFPLRPPPLKKFRALFEASDPSRLESDIMEESVVGEPFSSAPIESHITSATDSQTQSQTQGTRRPQRRILSGSGVLEALREEEEEESVRQSQAAGLAGRGTKRGIEDVGGDIEMGGETAKRQATTENRVDGEAEQLYTPNGVPIPANHGAKTVAAKGKEKDDKKEKNKGAPVGEPDKDAAFLKAVASTKKGKKHEDDFDREFNKLKISKPVLKDVQEVPQEEQWKVLEDFGDDNGVRGNFMTICELPVFRERLSQREREINPEWQGKPNFKKFKKKPAPGSERPKIDLLVNNAEEPSHPKAYSSQRQRAPATNGARGKKRLATLDEDREMIVSGDEDEEIAQPPPKKRARTGSVSSNAGKSVASNKAPSRAGSRAGSVAPQTRGKGKAKTQVQEVDRLFLSDEDESQSQFTFHSQGTNQRGGKEREMDVDINMTLEDNSEPDNDDFASGTLRSIDKKVERAKTRQRSQSARAESMAPEPKAAVKAKGKKKKPIVVQDDSDDDAVFKGF